MSNCLFTFKDPLTGKEQKEISVHELKAYLFKGGLEALLGDERAAALLGGESKTSIVNKDLTNKDIKFFSNHIKLVTDNIKKLRKDDVYRLFDEISKEKIDGLAIYIKSNRPDLAQEVDDVIAELGQPDTALLGGKSNQVVGAQDNVSITNDNASRLVNMISDSIEDIKHELDKAEREIRIQSYRKRTNYYKEQVNLAEKLRGKLNRYNLLRDKAQRDGDLSNEDLSFLSISTISRYLDSYSYDSSSEAYKDWQNVFNLESTESEDTQKAKIAYIEKYRGNVLSGATHTDNGKTEPVTQDVVTESLKTADESSPKISFKQSKDELLKQIDIAMENAPEEGDEKITFDIKGDGKFTVSNTKLALQAFRKKVEKASLQSQFSYPPRKTVTKQTDAREAIDKYIKEAELLKRKTKVGDYSSSDFEKEEAAYYAAQEYEDLLQLIVDIAENNGITDNEEVNRIREELGVKPTEITEQVAQSNKTDFEAKKAAQSNSLVWETKTETPLKGESYDYKTALVRKPDGSRFANVHQDNAGNYIVSLEDVMGMMIELHGGFNDKQAFSKIQELMAISEEAENDIDKIIESLKNNGFKQLGRGERFYIDLDNTEQANQEDDQKIAIAKKNQPLKFKLGKNANEILSGKMPVRMKDRYGDEVRDYFYDKGINQFKSKEGYTQSIKDVLNEDNVIKDGEYTPTNDDFIDLASLPKYEIKDIHKEAKKELELFNLAEHMVNEPSEYNVEPYYNGKYILWSNNIGAGRLFNKEFNTPEEAVEYGKKRYHFSKYQNAVTRLSDINAKTVNYNPTITNADVSVGDKVQVSNYLLKQSAYYGYSKEYQWADSSTGAVKKVSDKLMYLDIDGKTRLIKFSDINKEGSAVVIEKQGSNKTKYSVFGDERYYNELMSKMNHSKKRLNEVIKEELNKNPEFDNAAQAVQEEAKQPSVDEETESNIITLQSYDDFINRFYDGEAISLEEYKNTYQQILDNKESLIAELNKLTKEQLLRKYARSLSNSKNDSKKELVDSAYDEMITGFSKPKGGFSWSFGESTEKAISRVIDSLAQEDLNQFAEERKQAIAERKAEREEMLKGLENPQTIEDFNRVMSIRIEELVKDGESRKDAFAKARLEFTPEQRETYDELVAQKNRSNRGYFEELKKEQVAQNRVTTGAEIIKGVHTKYGYDIWTVKAGERVDKDVYNDWNATAKKLGGYYSSYRGNGAIAGFVFKSEESAQAFQKYISENDTDAVKEQAKIERDAFADDKSQTAAERLIEMADRLEDKATDILNADRKVNTAKRAREAGYAEANARHMISNAKTMRKIAEAIKDKSAKYLDRVRQKVQYYFVKDMLGRAEWHYTQANKIPYDDRRKHLDGNVEVADYAQFPSFTLARSEWEKLGRQLIEIDGTKKLGNEILKLVVDSELAKQYEKFAKDNINKVFAAKFADKTGNNVKVTSTKLANELIDKLGYKGKVIPFKYEKEIILIHSMPEAQRLGIFEPEDKQIDIGFDLGYRIVNKAREHLKHNESLKYTEVNWYIKKAYDDLEALKKLGIVSPAELRQALREFIRLQEAPEQPSKVKELERAMIGRKNDGLDFFPTPPETAQLMIDIADLKEGMKVLEPSAGWGHIADKIRDAGIEPDVIELSGDRRELLEAKGYDVVGRDFLNFNQGGYDVILMNPPFSDRRDAEHIKHAYDLLAPNGKLVAIAGEGVFFGNDKRAQEFREWFDKVGGTDEKLEQGTFQDKSLPVNTGANARLLVIEKGDQQSFDLDPEDVEESFDEDLWALFQPQPEAPSKFKQWFRNSWFTQNNVNSKNAPAEPAKFYHATNVDDLTFFDKSKLGSNTKTQATSGLGFFFSKNKADTARYGKTVLEVHLSAQNPLVTYSYKLPAFEDIEQAKRFSKALQDKGYDGIYLKDAGYAIVFKSNQAKLTSNTEPTDSDDIRYSKTKAEKPHTSKQSFLAAFTKQLDKQFGQGWSNLLMATGKVKVISRSDARKMGVDIDVQAFYSPSGNSIGRENDTTYFVYDNIEQGKDLAALAAHELGVHALQMGKDDKEFNAILSEVEGMVNAKNPSKEIQAAVARAKAANTKPKHFNEEVLAYLVEFHPNLSIVQKFLAWFKKKLRAIGKALPMAQRLEWFKHVTQLNETDLVYMAHSALRNAPSDLLFDEPTRKAGIRESFAGINAETANKSALAEAIRLKENKNNFSSPDYIFKKTGWYQGEDGKWRFEIDDSQAELTSNASYYIYKITNGEADSEFDTLSNILKHEKLYKAYPSIAYLTVNFSRDTSDTSRGTAFIKDGLIDINIGRVNSDDDVLSVLLHEIQHMIQAKEQFSNGGDDTQDTVDYVVKHLRDNLASKYDAKTQRDYQRLTNEIHELYLVDRYRRLLDYAHRDSITRNSKLFYQHPEYQMYYRDVWDNVGYPPKKRNVDKHREWIQDAAMFLANKMAKAPSTSFVRWMLKDFEKQGETALKNAIARTERALDRTRPVINAYESAKQNLNNAIDFANSEGKHKYTGGKYAFYKALAGEVEARNVQARRNLTEDERRELLPTRFRDYLGDLIVSPSSTYKNPFSYAGQKAKNADKSASLPSDYFKVIDNASVSQGTVDSMTAYSKLLSDLLVSKTFSSHGLNSFDVPTQRLVMSAVFSMLHNYKIRNSVIGLMPVTVMNNLTGQELSTDMLLHNMPMLSDLLSIDANKPISIPINYADRLAQEVASATTKLIDSTSSAGLGMEEFATVGTDDTGRFFAISFAGIGTKKDSRFIPLNISRASVKSIGALTTLNNRHKNYPNNVFDKDILSQNIKTSIDDIDLKTTPKEDAIVRFGDGVAMSANREYDSDLLEKMASFGVYPSDIDSDGYITVYHGGKKLPKSISTESDGGIFFMTTDYATAKDYADMRNGKVFEIKVKPEDINWNTGSYELEVQNGGTIENGVFSPTIKSKATKSKQPKKQAYKVTDVYGEQVEVNGQWYHAERVLGKSASSFKIGDVVSFEKENDDIRYSIASPITDFFTGEETRATTVDDIDAMLQTGRQPRRDTGLQYWKDKIVTAFADSTRPWERFVRDYLPDHASDILSGADRATGMKAAFEREAMNLFGRDIGKAIRAIKKANPKFDYKTAKDLAGTWLSTRYATELNDWLMEQDQQAVDDLIAQGASQAKIDKAKAEQAKRIAAINDTSIISPIAQPKDSGLAGGYNNATAERIKDMIESEIDVALLEELANHVYDMNEWTLRQDIRNGKISPAMTAALPNSRFYVPLVGDPRADKNMALTQNGIDASFSELEKSATYHGWKDFKDAIENAYDDLIEAKLDEGKTQDEAEREVWEENKIKRRSKGGLSEGDNDIVINGMIYTINSKEAMEALHSVNNEDVPSILKPIAYLTRLQARLVTQFMPLFAPTNMIRDVAERSENIRTRKIEGFNGDMNQVANDSIKNAARLLMKIKPVMMGVLAENTPLAKLFPVDNANPDVQDLKRFLALGGSSTYGDILSSDSKKLSDKLKATGTIPDNAMEAIHLYNNAFEMISGFSIYQSLIKQGLDERKAATASLNLMNFRKRGKYMNPIRALYMFAQPIAIGGHQLAKTLTTKRGLARFAAYTVAAALLYSLLRSGDDDDDLGINKMDEQGNFTLYRNILIPMGDGQYFKVPVGFGMQQLAWSHGVNFVRMAAGSMTPAETAAESIALWTKAAAPIAPAETAILKHPAIWTAQTFSPQIAKPIVNIGLDVNAFSAPLTNARYGKEDKAQALQGRRDTPEFYKMAAEELAKATDGQVDMYPEQLRELLRGYGAGVGNEMLKWAIENPAKEQRGLKTVSPVIDRYIQQSNDDSLKQRLYFRLRDRMNALNALESTGARLTPEEKRLADLGDILKKREAQQRAKLSAATKAERSGNMKKAETLRALADRMRVSYIDYGLMQGR